MTTTNPGRAVVAARNAAFLAQPMPREHITRMAPVRNHGLCAGITPAVAALMGVKPAPPQPHVPWPVGRGWICLRCSHYARGDKDPRFG